MIFDLEERRDSSMRPARKTLQTGTSTIASVVAVSLEEYLTERGQDGANVLQAAGLDRDALRVRHSRFPSWQLSRALGSAAQREDDPFFGLHFGEWYQPRILHACNYAISCAPTLHDALTSLQDHRNLVAEMPTRLSDNGAFTELSWIIDGEPDSLRHVIDFKAMRTLKHIQLAAGQDWRPLRVCLTYEKPDNVSEHLRLFGPKIFFDQPINSFWIDSSTLKKPMPDADPDIFHMAHNSFRNPFPCTQEEINPVDRLKRLMSDRLEKNDVTLASASQHLGMTVHQLRRLLKKRGTCFQYVLNDTRKAHAAHYLCATELRFSEIAFLLGFSDQSAFTRAVKRWYDMTPKELRRGNAR